MALTTLLLMLTQVDSDAAGEPATQHAFESLRHANEQLPTLIAGEIIARLKIDCAMLAGFLVLVTLGRVLLEWRIWRKAGKRFWF